MKQQSILKSALCLIMAMLCNVAWANFTQQWTNSPVGPWSTTASTENPEGITNPLASASKDGTTVHKAMVDVCAPANGTVTVQFVYSGGGHKLNIVGVDLVGADGAVKASDYHYGTTGGSHVNNTFTMANVEAGDYTLRYFVCDNSKDNDRLSSTIGTITVTGLELNRLKYNVGDGNYKNRTDNSSSAWRPGWTSTNAAKPSLTIAVGANNMNAGVTEYIGMRPGASGCTYTLTLGEPFIRYSFEAKSTNSAPNDNNRAHVITINGEQTTVGAEWTTFMVDVYGTTTQFQLTGSNNHDLYIRNIKFVQEVPVASKDEFMNGGVYTFVTSNGWMGAKADNGNVISTAKSAHGLTGSATDAMFQWTVYKSANGNYYLYNLGKQMFMGVQSTNNSSVPFAAQPAGKKLTFKQSGSAEYPIMFSTDNNGVVNHNGGFGDGLITWTGGWNNLNDAGSNHKVTLVSRLPEATLQEIAAKVAAYDRSMPIKVEVEGWTENNPNTHFGNATATTGSNVSTTKLLTAHMAGGNMAYSSIGDVVTFTREYRGFDFQGYYAGEQSLGKSFTITEELASSITAENPLVAKFTTTDDVTIWYDDDPFSYRIPAIGKTSSGRLIAVSDYRYSLDDIGRYNYGTATPGIDLVIRMSDDNGKTWGETKTIAKGSCVRNTNDCAYGDAAIAVVGQKVLVMGAAGDVMFGNGSATAHNRTVRIFSENNGETWTDPQDISETLFIGENATIKNGYTAFFGSGKLAVDENYNNTGNARIYGAMLIRKEGNGSAIYVIYTDDFGVTWSILGGSQNPITSNDEPKVEILPSGQILLSVRRGGGRQFNVFTYTNKATNEGSWNSNVDGCGNGGSNTCNGEIYVVDAKKANGDAVKLLLQSQPKGGSGLYDRRDVTIWYKEITDAAYTSEQIAGNWTQGMQVSNQLSAYSTMVLQEDGKIAFFFEEAPCYGDDQAKGYSMVYTPLTIESITKGNYFSPSTNLEAATTIDVVLTDANGNTYKEQLTECKVGEIAAKLQAKYPFVTLGGDISLAYDGVAYTYANTMTLPFKVSNEETTVWHNIYIPSNTNSRYPVYFYSESNANTVKSKAVSVDHGASDYNTQAHADNMSWAIYSVDNGFTFTFKNKLTGKYIKVSQPASGKNQNVQYGTKEDATAFSIEKNTSYRGDYIIKHETGHLSVYGATDGYLTFYSGNYHWGSTAKIVEAPDFEALIADINGMLGTIGTSLGQYNVAEANAEALEAAKEAMQNSATVKLNALNSYKTLLNGATLNMPKDGQYFRVAYDYGGSVGKLYMQGEASSVKGVQFTAEAGDASIWQYRDGSLYSCSAKKNLREYDDDRGLSDIKTTVAFSASSRAKGKYNIKCGSFIHANSSNGNYYSDHCSGDGGHAAHDFILEEVEGQAFTLNVTSAGYATLYLDYAVAIPSDVEVYIVKGVRGDLLKMTQVTDVLPANTGAIVRAQEGTYDFVESDEESTVDVTDNMLRGTIEDEYIVTDYRRYYVLAKIDGVVGMYLAKLTNGRFLNNANKAYLVFDPTRFGGETDTENQLSNRLRFDFGGTTSIEKTTDNSQQTTVIYDLMGRRVENPTKGIYIVGGKKMFF